MPATSGIWVGHSASAAYREVVPLGIGLNIKRYKWDNMGDTRRQVIEGVLYDGGVDVSGEVLNRNDYTLTAAAGFSYSNFGGSLDQELTGIFLPDGDEVDPPENRRCGFNMTFKSPSWEKTDRVFSTTLAAVFASFDCDIVDRAYADADT